MRKWNIIVCQDPLKNRWLCLFSEPSILSKRTCLSHSQPVILCHGRATPTLILIRVEVTACVRSKHNIRESLATFFFSAVSCRICRVLWFVTGDELEWRIDNFKETNNLPQRPSGMGQCSALVQLSYPERCVATSHRLLTFQPITCLSCPANWMLAPAG